MVADSGGSGAASIIEESGSGFALNACGHLLGRLGALTSMAWAVALRSLCLMAWTWCGRFAVMELERWRVLCQLNGAASIIEESGSGFALNACGHLLGRLGALTSMAWAVALRSLDSSSWERWRVGSWSLIQAGAVQPPSSKNPGADLR